MSLGYLKKRGGKLEAYDWPGNVRELANVIERAVVLGSGPTVTLEDLPGRIAAGWTTPASATQSYREGLNAARKELLLKALPPPKEIAPQRRSCWGLKRSIF